MTFKYEGAKRGAISFPLGGIGSGCVGLAGNGRLTDWEIFNHPNKGRLNGCSHIAVKAEAKGEVIDARVLQGDELPPFMGGLGNRGFGHGTQRETLIGLPHFRECSFESEFPFATVKFSGERFPGGAVLTAFNPFIPMNDFDSSLPVAMFEVTFNNDRDYSILYTACFSLQNPIGAGTGVNARAARAGLDMLHMSCPSIPGDSGDFGDLTIATDCSDSHCQEYWYRGGWFDSLVVFWGDFTRPSPLPERHYDCVGADAPNGARSVNDAGSLCASVELAPGETKSIRFALSWSFPNCVNIWNADRREGAVNSWKNYYATKFENSLASGEYALANWRRLARESRLFAEAIHSTSMPPYALDAVTANLAVLKSPTCLRLTDGSFYGFEGCNCDIGSCEGTCTHVWNYAYAMPYLFPTLERSIRELDYRYNIDERGMMAFRMQLPLGRTRSTFRSCADGQFGGVIKTYREWKLSGDTEWLKRLWPEVKRSIEYAWRADNYDLWDPQKRGVLTGRQHHTLDMELYGPNSWLTGFYLAALKAGAEMAEALGEADTAARYAELFARGKAYCDGELFNGEYYGQKLDISDRAVLDAYAEHDPNVYASYWDDEHGQIKYQIGSGCIVDQVLAQWHANLVGLGEIFDKANVKKALGAIYNYNYKTSMRDHANPCRIYAAQDEAGVCICEWPDMATKPRVPIYYAEECMNGFEYQAAIHMIQEGMIDEGLEIIKAIRARYDGERRNPWNEFECGSNYARSMASFAILPTLMGFGFDMRRGMLGFKPVFDGYRSFWAAGAGWGTFEARNDGATLTLLRGNLTLSELELPALEGALKVTLDGKEIHCARTASGVAFESALTLSPESELVVSAV